MRYTVVVQPAAYREIEGTYCWIRKETGAERARAWRAELMGALRSLATMPARCPPAPEAEIVGQPLRHLLHHSHRILYVVAGREVRVVSVRHCAQGPFLTP